MGFDTVLVANRGEIACRVLRSARALGYRTVAVYSDADADALHVHLADRAVRLGPAPAADSYLSADAILAAARATGAGAIHPGYGFLAENATFAEAVAAAGLIFVGPPAEAIAVMGSKRRSKLRMAESGVPCIPGYSGEEQDLAHLLAEAERIGPPLMIKASAGGGGRGLRLVRDLREVPGQLEVARAEAISAFGDGELILERALERPRHVEIQVLADASGHVVHLFERDCSVQRRHQKIIEEAPSPAVDPELRARMGEAAVRAARAIGYVGAGTVEMLLDADGAFYFMEMNTRLQVEHPVTEMITGLDLVALQIDVAAGRDLPFGQGDLRIRGHAIEARLYAEDPQGGFLPQTGRVERWRPPEGEGLRVDHGLVEGYRVTADYDAMVAKLIAHGRDREQARRRLVRALEQTSLHGLRTNQAFLVAALEHPSFVSGDFDTGFVPTHLDTLVGGAYPDEAWAVAGALLATRGGGPSWSSTGGTGTRTLRVVGGNEDLDLHVRPAGADAFGPAGADAFGPAGADAFGPAGADAFEIGGRGDESLAIEILHRGPDRLRFRFRGVDRAAVVTEGPDWVEVGLDGSSFVFDRVAGSRATGPVTGVGGILAPMAAKVVAVHAAEGDQVERGDLIVVIEAMKMQLELTAPRAGRVHGLAVREGDQVNAKQTLVTIALDPQGPEKEEESP